MGPGDIGSRARRAAGGLGAGGMGRLLLERSLCRLGSVHSELALSESPGG